MKIVLDTNILWVSISRYSKTHWVIDELIKGKYTLCITTDILNEYAEIISQKLGSDTAKGMLELFDNLHNVAYITNFYRWGLIDQDFDDNKFVDCAIASNAHYLATNDKHFNILKGIEFPKVQVINVLEFRQVLDTI